MVARVEGWKSDALLARSVVGRPVFGSDALLEMTDLISPHFHLLIPLAHSN
jgi:hypothetical protein